MAINRISIENFTVFDKIELDFCNGINVFIGENGTGKTHLLKILYAYCGCGHRTQHKSFDLSLTDCFRTDNILSLIRHVNSISIYPLSISVTDTSGKAVGYGVSSGSKSSSSISGEKQSIPAIYIPAKDMLTHGGLEKDYIDRNLPFDITLIDILNKAGVSTIKKLPEDKLAVLNRIARIIDGKILYKNDRYYTEKSDGTLIDFAAEAEGFKKLGLLYRLIETGHLEKGNALIWDEPEANLNPKLIPFLVDVLLSLEQAGVQMFLATHDYFFAKYLELKKAADSNVVFHSLYKNENDEDRVYHESAYQFTSLENNKIISEQFNLYQVEVKKVLG